MGLDAPEPVLDAARLRLEQLLPGAAPQAVANLLWAFADMRYDPGSAFCEACIQHLLVTPKPQPMVRLPCKAAGTAAAIK